MALSFGPSVPTVDTTGVSNGGNLSYGNNGGSFSLTDWMLGTDNLSKGTPIIGSSSDYMDAVAATGVNTTQLDGSAGHTNWLANMAGAVLGAIGAQNDTPQTTYTPVSSGGSGAGFDLRTIAVVGVIGAAIYYVASK